MKKTITLLIFLITTILFAQAPQKMNYQAVLRNSNNALIANKAIGMQVSILQGSITGTAVYAETQSPMTNANGLVAIEIGGGTPVTGTFAAIDWANGPYFIKTETDPNGGANYTITGTSQLLSAPYAFYAQNTKNPGKTTIRIAGDSTDVEAAQVIKEQLGPNTENIYIQKTNQLTNVDLSGLKNLDRLSVESNENLQTIKLDGLKSTYNSIHIYNNPKLKSLSFPALNYTYGIHLSGNNLSSLSLPSLNYTSSIYLSGNNLSSSYVNDILHTMVNCKPISGKYIDLSGQNPPAPPTGQGLIDLQTLRDNGNTVEVDSNGEAVLELTIKDGNNNNIVIPGVDVYLYDSPTTANTISYNTSDSNGKVKFNKLKNQIYYFGAYANVDTGCKTNIGNYSTITVIPLGVTTLIDVKMYSTGSLELKNMSAKNYNVYYGSSGQFTKLVTSSANTDRSYDLLPGTYTLKTVLLDNSGNETSTVTTQSITIVECNTTIYSSFQ